MARSSATCTLLILRHAKSSWAQDGQDDHERPLAPRGLRASRRMGRLLRERGLAPSLVLCSSAIRTRQTLAELVDFLPDDVQVQVERDLYLASSEALLARLRAVDGSPRALLLLGHNPGVEELAAALAGKGEPAALARMRRKFPTAALAELTFAGPWAELAAGGAELVHFTTPRSLE